MRDGRLRSRNVKRARGEIEAPLLSQDAERRTGESLVGRGDPALHERGPETVGPLQLDRVVVGDVAIADRSPRRGRGGPSRSPRRQLAR